MVFSRLSVVLAGLVALAPLAAQQSTLFDTVDVTVVNVDVVVTDSKGNPIRGLTRDDFVVEDSGQVMTVTNFSAIESGRLLLEPDRPVDPQTAPSPGFEAEAAPRLDLMILVDNTSIQPQNRHRLVEQVGGILDRVLRPGDRAMVAANDGEVELLVGLTDDRKAIATALEKAARKSSRAVGAATEFTRVVRDLELAGDNSSADIFASECRGVFSSIRSYSSSRYSDSVRSAGAIREWVNSLAALPGRKAVLMLSDGFSNNPGDALLQAWQRKCEDVVSTAQTEASGNEFDTARVFLDLADHANANRVTFYTIGGEVRLTSSTSADSRGLDASGARVWSPGLEALEESNLRSTLAALSAHTGGLSGVGVSALGDLANTMRRDFDNYYSLAYTPTAAGDGANRAIDVRFATPRPGLQLRFREGYRDKPLDERLEDQAISVALLGEGPNPLALEMRTGALVPAEKDLVDVPVMMRFPLDRVVLVPGAEVHEGRLLLVVTARDARGRLSPPQRIAIPVSVPAAMAGQLAGQYAGYSTTLRLRRGAHRIALVVRDLVGGVDSTTFFDHDPG